MMLCLLPHIDAAVALALGIIFSLAFGNPLPKFSANWSKKLLQISVIGLGFGVGIGSVLREGEKSIVYTIVGIVFTLLFGAAIGRMLKVNTTTSRLISFGTAICGGSAIAALAPVIKAKDEEVAVSLATVFTLNAVALFLFPIIGHLLKLNQQSFGIWSGLAIHDTSSVVGAASSYGHEALMTGVTVKLTRALWITPFVIGFAIFGKSKSKITIPYFIFGFIAAAIISSLFQSQNYIWNELAFVAKRLLVVTLFLIGTGLSRETIKRVGVQPMAQGIILWMIVSITTLTAILLKVIQY
ncbi:MAG: putative sulfate exporter family transporter [Ignavibacteriales bacterium]|nr:putative sulfate exporter family transporter [Ignavibacteriales bacterium]